MLYHGLGAGKTCASIGIAEGIKHKKKIMVFTPASLRANYISELKFCGDSIYKKNQYWEFIKIDNKDTEIINAMSNALNLTVETIKKQGGAWFVNVSKESNFKELSLTNQKLIDEQINHMIRAKYQFINYNGLRNSHLLQMEEDALKSNKYSNNPFDNKVIIIDEAHNFVGRIVNKIKTKKDSISIKLYKHLMGATNCKIIFLTGTPMINYSNELGVLFNMLRGYIKTYVFSLTIQTNERIDEAYIKKILAKTKWSILLSHEKRIFRRVQECLGQTKQCPGANHHYQCSHICCTPGDESIFGHCRPGSTLFCHSFQVDAPCRNFCSKQTTVVNCYLFLHS